MSALFACDLHDTMDVMMVGVLRPRYVSDTRSLLILIMRFNIYSPRSVCRDLRGKKKKKKGTRGEGVRARRAHATRHRHEKRDTNRITASYDSRDATPLTLMETPNTVIVLRSPLSLSLSLSLPRRAVFPLFLTPRNASTEIRLEKKQKTTTASWESSPWCF